MLQSSQLLLLTGPAGSGKTATVRVLAKHLQLEVQEWVNPITDTYVTSPEFTQPLGKKNPFYCGLVCTFSYLFNMFLPSFSHITYKITVEIDIFRY